MVVAGLFLFAETLLDEIVVRLASALLLAVKDLGGCGVRCCLIVSFFLRVGEEVIVFITRRISRLLFGSL